MHIEWHEVVVWLIVGALAGTLVGRVVKHNREGFGVWYNLGIGLVGAVIGGLLFNLLKIDYGMSQITISLQDLVSALVGSLIFLLAIWIYRKTRSSRSTATKSE